MLLKELLVFICLYEKNIEFIEKNFIEKLYKDIILMFFQIHIKYFLMIN